jgi:hypothetical protein
LGLCEADVGQAWAAEQRHRLGLYLSQSAFCN